jgi:DNA-binding MarR family transcriptional regulator
LQHNCSIMSGSVIPVIALWEEFHYIHPEKDMQQFAWWIIKEKFTGREAHGEMQTAQPRQKGSGIAKRPMVDFAKALLLINRLSKLTEMRTKPILKKLGIERNHEYGILVQIFLLGRPNKKQVASAMLMENSTVVEATNRLVRTGFIKEISDPEDRRSTLLLLTEKGIKKMNEVNKEVKKAHEHFLDGLNDSEKYELLSALQKLEQFNFAAASFT